MASEAVTKIQELIAQHGDRPMGFQDLEFQGFVSIGAIELRSATPESPRRMDTDEESLGPQFFGITPPA